MSEAGGGSDVAAIKTTARKDGGDYVIDGSKMWITNGAQADWLCLLANTSDGPVHNNKTLIIVPMKTGRRRDAQDRQARHARVRHRAIFFDDVRVPQRHLIGEEGMGFTIRWAVPGGAPVGRGAGLMKMDAPSA